MECFSNIRLKSHKNYWQFKAAVTWQAYFNFNCLSNIENQLILITTAEVFLPHQFLSTSSYGQHY